MSRLSLVVPYLLFWMNFVSAEEEVQCKGPNGDTVDWFFVYKLPFLARRRDDRSNDYIYVTSSTVTEGWKMGVDGLNYETSLVARTLSPLYNGGATNYWIYLYNNYPPTDKNGRSVTSAKGVVMANNNHGFWLIHSLEKFPHQTSKIDSLAKLNTKGGHLFLCISVQAQYIRHIMQQVKFMSADIYYENNPGSPMIPPALSALSNTQEIYSTDSMLFTSFAHRHPVDPVPNFDIFCDYLMRELNSDLYVKTPIPNTNRLRYMYNTCASNSKYNIFNVKNLWIQLSPGQQALKTMCRTDKSKWAISMNNNHNTGSNYVCISDVDRTIRDITRGGGFVCVQSPEIWQLFKQLIKDEEDPSCGDDIEEDIIDVVN